MPVTEQPDKQPLYHIFLSDDRFAEFRFE